jgi:hypothetical protein
MFSECVSWNLGFNVKFKPPSPNVLFLDNIDALDIQSRPFIGQRVKGFHEFYARGIFCGTVEFEGSKGAFAPYSDDGRDKVSKDAFGEVVDLIRDFGFDGLVKEFNGETTESDHVVDSFT